jgi:hypothetical protein
MLKMKMSGKLLWLAALVSLGQVARADTADFQSRCAASGVLKCIGFDSSADLAHYDAGGFLYPAGDGSYRGVQDTTVMASGTGALRYDVPATSGANSSGDFIMPFGHKFVPGETFYVQYRFRIAPGMLSNGLHSDEGWKQSIFHQTGATCSGIELTTEQFYNKFPIMYSQCGAQTLQTTLAGGDYGKQQGDYDCRYQAVSAGDISHCFVWPVNQWMTFYYQVTLGAWNTPASTINAWVALDGQPMKQWIRLSNISLTYANNPATDGYNSIDLTIYASGRTSAAITPTSAWYDELIVSSQPIAAPGGAVVTPPVTTVAPPAAPSDLSFQAH